ncbi:MAG: tRNA-binding protein [Microgenomates group bacterium]
MITTSSEPKQEISYEQFVALDMRIATVIAVDEVAEADKLYKITLDVGELGERIIASGIKPWYTPAQLVGKQVIYLANLKPRTLRGIESQGMLIAANDEKAILLHPDSEVTPGSPLL